MKKINWVRLVLFLGIMFITPFFSDREIQEFIMFLLVIIGWNTWED